MAGMVEKTLADLGIDLPSPASPIANYVACVRSGNLLVVSGQLCFGAEGKLEAKGQLGAGVSIEDGQKAARACAVNLLAQIKAVLGDLDKVTRVVRLGGFINSAPGFTDGPKVMNGASDLMVEVFGDKGRHARSTVGVSALPADAAVEVEGMFEVVDNGSMPGLDWLTARPIAHRGLHDAAAGVIENTASAFAAAIAGDYAIETDLQISADGEAMVHHDDALGRLTDGSGRLAALSAAEIKAVRFKATADRILTLGELCDLVGGRATLVIELKSHFDGDRRLVQRAADVLANYAGPVAVMSFDPAMVEAARQIAPGLPRGIVAERHYAHHEWDRLPPSAEAADGASAARHAHAPAFRRLWNQGFAGGGAIGCAVGFRPAAADLDRAQPGRPPAAPRAGPIR